MPLITYEYERPACAATAAILSSHSAGMSHLNLNNTMILLGKRDENKPAGSFTGYWCLPGGFLNVAKERTITTVRRETREECSIDIDESRWSLFDVDDRPGADPRFDHVINVCYYAFVTKEEYDKVEGDDDISEVKWVTFKKALKIDLAFDHNIVLRTLIDVHKIMFVD